MYLNKSSLLSTYYHGTFHVALEIPECLPHSPCPLCYKLHLLSTAFPPKKCNAGTEKVLNVCCMNKWVNRLGTWSTTGRMTLWRNNYSNVSSPNALPEPYHLSSINEVYCPSSWTWMGLCKCLDEYNTAEVTLSTPVVGQFLGSSQEHHPWNPAAMWWGRAGHKEKSQRGIPLETGPTKC